MPSDDFNVATPIGLESPTQGDDRFRELKRAIQERLALDHVFTSNSGTGDNDAGLHKKVTFYDSLGSSPTPGTGQGILYSLVIDAKDELHYIADGVSAKQITSGGKLNIVTGDIVLANLDDATINLDGSNKIRIKDAGVAAAQIADNAVLAAKIPDGEITEAKLASAAKPLRAFVAFNGEGAVGPISPSADNNVSTVEKLATGDYKVTFDTPMTHLNFTVATSAAKKASGSTLGRFAMVHEQELTYFTIRVSDYSGSLSLEDSPLVSASVFSLTE